MPRLAATSMADCPASCQSKKIVPGLLLKTLRDLFQRPIRDVLNSHIVKINGTPAFVRPTQRGCGYSVTALQP